MKSSGHLDPPCPREYGQGRRVFARSLSGGASLSAPGAECACGVVGWDLAVDAESSCRDGGSLSLVAGRGGVAVLRAADGLVPSSGWFVERGAFDSCSSGVPCPCSHWL